MSNRVLYGVATNDADYPQQIFEYFGYIDGKQQRKIIWICPFYQTWKAMLNRVYNQSYKDRCPTYEECSVCKEWHLFSNFKKWMETQDWEGKQLDKDLLSRARIYSPETCVFVTSTVNMFLLERGRSRGDWPIGVSLKIGRKGSIKFVAACRNPFTKKREHLGIFLNPDEAHKAWLIRKLELAKLLAAEQDDPRVAEALVRRYENYQQD